jgi:tRNA(Ile)-lysidine synthase
MANSRKPPPNKVAGAVGEPIVNHCRQFLAELLSTTSIDRPKLLVAFSGGLDSSVLLHLLFHLRKAFPFQLSAVHVHHGLSPNADAWATFCEKTCDHYQIPLAIKRVNIDHRRGLGIEAAAREARYHAIFSTNADWIFLAHHQNDQAETLLLQLARGAGVKGLAAMAARDPQRRLFRPLLPFTRTELEAYASYHGLQWVDDESNETSNFDRNFIRHEVLTVLKKRYPAIVQTLSRSAAHFAAASQLQDDLAALDAAQIIEIDNGHRLNLTGFSKLAEARQANLLRWWLMQAMSFTPSTVQLQQMLHQFLQRGNDTRLKIKVGKDFHIRRYQDWAYLVRDIELPAQFSQSWHGESEIVLPDHSTLTFTKVLGKGLSTNLVTQDAPLSIRYRRGGERFFPEAGRPVRTLKYILQQAEVPLWQRDRIPLIFNDNSLVYVPNVGANESLKAREGELGYVITWRDSNGSGP